MILPLMDSPVIFLASKTTPANRRTETRVLGFKYTAIGPQSNSHLQFNRFNF